MQDFPWGSSAGIPCQLAVASAEAAWATDAVGRIAKRDVIVKVAKAAVEALATSDSKDSRHRMGFVVEQPLEYWDASGFVAWIDAFAALEIPSGFAGFDMLDTLAEASVLRDVT